MNTPMSALIGHRGLPTAAPENTRASIVAASRAGISWVEIDVTMAGDGTLVIMHDADLRLFGKDDIRLVDVDRLYLLRQDAGRWYDEAFAGEPLLFLEQLLPLVRALNLGLNLEIKINPDLSLEQQTHAVFSQLELHHIIGDKLVVSSFEHQALRLLRQRHPAIQLAPLFDTLVDDPVADTSDLQPVSIHYDQALMSEPLANKIVGKVPLYCYTVNDAATLEKLLALGISGVFSDRANAPELRDLAEQFSIDR